MVLKFLNKTNEINEFFSMAHTQATWKALSIIFSRMALAFTQFQYRMNPTLKSTTNQWTGHPNNCSHLFGTMAQMWEQNWWPLNRFTSIIHTPIQFWWAISAINSNALQAENVDYNCFLRMTQRPHKNCQLYLATFMVED